MNRLLIFLFSVVIFAGNLSGQETVSRLKEFVSNIATFNTLFPQEKVYLHLDNNSYLLGETIWFKAYTLTSSLHQPTTKSAILYVEILNSKGKVLDTKKLRIVNGTSHGEFYLNQLNVEYFPGYYEIRAYTLAMLDAGVETAFSRYIPVVKEENGKRTIQPDRYVQDLNLKDLRRKSEKRKDLNIAFFPEGGNMVEGITSKVAFKITDKKGNPVEAKGEVRNNEGRVITPFHTLHEGMGVFNCNPEGKKQTVVINYKGKEYTYHLPESRKQGYVLSIDNIRQTEVCVEIKKRNILLEETIGLTIICRGEPIVFREINFREDTFRLKIEKKILPAGVNIVFLFDKKGNILAERKIFIHPTEKDISTLQVKGEEKKYKPLEKVTLQIQTQKPHPGTSLSLAVRDPQKSIGKATEQNIASYLLLSSDLKGYIHQPEYYLQENTPEKRMAADLLMMVNGWKRYEWKNMIKGKEYVPQFQREKTFRIKGHVKGLGKKQAAIKLRMDNGEGLWMEGETWTDKKGNFLFEPEEFYGKWFLTLRCMETSEAYKNIRLERWFSPQPGRPEDKEIEFLIQTGEKEKQAEEIQETQRMETQGDSISLLLQEVEIKEKSGRTLTYDVGKDIDRMIDKGERIPFSVHEYLVEKNNGYVFISDDPDVPFENSVYEAAGGHFLFIQRPAGLWYFTKEKEWKHNSSGEWTYKRNIFDIEKITINEHLMKAPDPITIGPYILILIYPYQYYPMRTLRETRYTTFEGFSSVRDFYREDMSEADMRTESYNYQRTIFWNPEISLDHEGKATVSFFNNLSAQEFEISIEGITGNGIPLIYNKE